MDEKSVSMRRRAAVAAIMSVLVALPAYALAAPVDPRFDQSERARSIFNMVIERLCQLQQAHGNRIQLIDPARCVPVPPPPQAPTLTLMKIVINDNGGTATESNFQAMVDGGNVSWGVAQALPVGAHTASEVTLPGYTASSWDGDCAANGTITLAAGENKTCTITNDDIAQTPTTGHLTVTKIVVNDNDGTATTSDFALFVDGGTVTSGVANTFATGTHTVSETGSAGYTALIGGDCAADGSITLAAGDVKSCTITNDDIAQQPVIGHVVISEAQYDVASTTVSGTDSLFEWIELYNGSATAISLQGWFVGDASSTDVISGDVIIQSGGYAVVAASTTPAGVPAGVPIVVLHSSIGTNGFGNGGDGVVLRNTEATLIDSVGYGTNGTVSPNVPIPSTHDGHSLVRVQLTSDTDTAADWADSAAPTPGS